MAMVFGAWAFVVPTPASSQTTLTENQEAPETSASPESQEEHPYIVVLKDYVDHPGAVADAQVEQQGGDLGFVYHSALKGYSATLSKEGVQQLEGQPNVAFVQPDTPGELTAQSSSTGIGRIYAPLNPALEINASEDLRVDADVAVLDSGIDQTHPDLNVFGRTNCVGPDQNTPPQACVDGAGSDANGHGTKTAGAIGALDNSIGAVGVAPGARLWSVRVARSDGIPSASWVVAAVDWVTAHADQIEVANLSIRFQAPHPELEAAISASMQEGVVYVVAAGNDAEDIGSKNPASYPDVITVSALADYDGQPGGGSSAGAAGCNNPRGPDDTLSTESNFGPLVDIAAPGVCIRTTTAGGGYGQDTGTSIAAPHVTGAAAILASEENPNSFAEVQAIRNAIVGSGNLNWSDTSGDGVKEPLLDVGSSAIFNPLSTKPTFSLGFGSPGTGAGEFDSPQGIAIGPDGNIWVADYANNRIQKFDSQGNHLASVGSSGSGIGEFAGPWDVSVDPGGNVWVSDDWNHRIQKFDAQGNHVTGFETGSMSGPVSYPFGLDVDSAGNIWVADSGTHSVKEFDPGGDLITSIGSFGSGTGQLKFPRDVAIDQHGNVWIVDTGNYRVQKFDADGDFLAAFGVQGTDPGEFQSATSIAIDADGNVWIVDSSTARVQRFDSEGHYVTRFGSAGTGTGQFQVPFGIATDATAGIWVTDRSGDEVQKWSR